MVIRRLVRCFRRLYHLTTCIIVSVTMAATLTPSRAFAQRHFAPPTSQPTAIARTSWQAWLDSGWMAVGRRFQQPDVPDRDGLRYPCARGVDTPDSVALVGDPQLPLGDLEAWWENQGDPAATWGTVQPPAGITDTLRAKVVGAYCPFPDDPLLADINRPTLLVEQAGYYYGIPASFFWVPNDYRNGIAEPVTADDDDDSDPSPRHGTGRLVLPGHRGIRPGVWVSSRSGWALKDADVYNGRIHRAQSEAAARRAARIRGYGWAAGFTEAVIARRVSVGMTAQMVLEAWGRPVSVNRSLTASGKSEQWLYAGAHYVYLQNDVVTEIHDSR